jgi:hypothetical protein
MSNEPEKVIEVLRGIWSTRGQTSSDLDESFGHHQKSCKNMANVGFDGLAEADADANADATADLQAAWRNQLEREGKLNPEAGTVRDLIFGPAESNQ